MGNELVLGHLEHDVEHELLDDGAQGAGAGFFRKRLVRDDAQRAFVEFQLDVVVVHEHLVLLDYGVVRLGQDVEQHVLRERLHGADDGQAADELRDEPVFLEVFGRHVGYDVAVALEGLLDGAGKAHASALVQALGDDVVQAGERAAADEQDIARVDHGVARKRRLHAARERHIHLGSLKHLEKTLLHRLAANVASAAGAFRPAIA